MAKHYLEKMYSVYVAEKKSGPYVGCTKDLRTRTNRHRSSIRSFI
jgi:predicted GIY-YIG superfamily endonuclease